MTSNYFVSWTLVFAFIVSAVGCSQEEGERRFPVSGTVTQKGKPIEGAIVAFTPEADGRPASGVTDASGKYILTTLVSGDGAVPGKYKVTIAKYDKKLAPAAPKTPGKATDPYDITNEYPADYNEMQASEIAAAISKNLLPAKFANPNASGLQAVVAEQENTFDFKVD